MIAKNKIWEKVFLPPPLPMSNNRQITPSRPRGDIKFGYNRKHMQQQIFGTMTLDMAFRSRTRLALDILDSTSCEFA